MVKRPLPYGIAPGPLPPERVVYGRKEMQMEPSQPRVLRCFDSREILPREGEEVLVLQPQVGLYGTWFRGRLGSLAEAVWEILMDDAAEVGATQIKGHPRYWSDGQPVSFDEQLNERPHQVSVTSWDEWLKFQRDAAMRTDPPAVRDGRATRDLREGEVVTMPVKEYEVLPNRSLEAELHEAVKFAAKSRHHLVHHSSRATHPEQRLQNTERHHDAVQRVLDLAVRMVDAAYLELARAELEGASRKEAQRAT